MVDDPRWDSMINERAAAVGFETWPNIQPQIQFYVFMELTSVN